MRNNRKKVIAKTAQDLYYDRLEHKTELTKEDVLEQMASTFRDKTYTVFGDNDILTSNNKFRKRNTKGNKSKMDEAIKKLKDNHFFDVITGKKQDGSSLINRTIDLNNKLNHTNQKVKANSSLTSVQTAYSNFKNVINNKGKFHVYDLETIGGDNRDGVWSPIGITEFSVHTKDFKNDSVSKTDVFMGMSRKEANELQEKIFKAIDEGTLDRDGDLAVTAMRMSMYGNAKTDMQLTDQGYYKITNFVDSNEAEMTNKKMIAKGFDRHVEAYNKTKIIDGMRASEKAVLDKILEVNTDLSGNNAMIAGFNDTLFDAPIVNKYLQDVVSKNKNIINNSLDNNEVAIANATLEYYNNIFNIGKGGKAVFSPTANQHIDMRSAVDLFKGYFGIDTVYAGNKDELKNAGGRMLRQEHIAGAHLKKRMEGGVAHVASFDVEMLMALFLEKSELTDISFIDYMMRGDGEHIKGLNSINEVNGKIKVNDQLYKAKKTSRATQHSKQGHLNFMYDRKNDTYYTADGYEIGKKGVDRKTFDLGTKINNGQYYTVGGIKKIDASSEWGQLASGILPELSTQDLFMLQMDIQTADSLKNSAIADTSRYFFFKTEDELESFMSSTFLKVAEKNDAGEMAIIKSKEVMKELEIRKLKKNKNGTTGMVLEKGFWDNADIDILNRNIELSNKKLLASRAENAVFGDNSFKKINQSLKIQKAVEQKIGEKISGQELAQIMSGHVTSEKILGKIDKRGLSKLQNEIVRIAGYRNNLLPTTQTSLSVAYDVIDKQSDALRRIYPLLGNSGKLNGGETNQLVFDHVLKQLKMDHAKEYYGEDPTKIRNAIFNNKQALMSTADIENFYEINLKKMAKSTNELVVDMAKPSSTKDILRINLEHGKEYDFLNKLVKVKYGDRNIDPTKKEAYELDSLNEFLKIFSKERPQGKKSVAYKGFDRIDSLKAEIASAIESGDKINPHEITSRLFDELRGIKQANPVLGILNTEATMSSLFNVDKNLLESFNNYVTDDKIQKAIDSAPSIINFRNKKDIESFVNNKLMNHYMPSKEDFFNAKGNINKNQKHMLNSLYETTRAGHIKNLTGIIEASTSAGAKISVQDDGTLVLFMNGEYQTLDRIAKTKLHKESGVLYHQVGQQKVVANSKVAMRMNGNKADLSLTSNLEDINKSMGNLVNTIKKKVQNDTFELSDLAWSQSKIAKALVENSSLQTFNPHDVKSNYRLDYNDIKNILPALFKDDGALRDKMDYIDRNGGFKDRHLIEHVKEAIGNKTEIDEMAPTLKHNLVKNIQDILLAVVDDDTDLKKVISNSNWTSKENQVAELVAHVGDRYQSSVMNPFDANNRPTIAQAGRGRYVKKSNVEKAIKSKAAGQVLFEGSIITSENAKQEMFRNVEGIGEMMTNVSFRRRFVGSDSLKVILDTKFDEVIANAKIGNLQEKHIRKMYGQLYDTINTFEQEKHIDSRVFEKVYGKAADIQRLSVGADIVKPLENKTLTEEASKKYKDMLEMIGNIELDNSGNLTYKGHVGKIVQKGDKIIDYASFGDTSKTWTSKIHNGVLNYGFFSLTDGQQLDEEGISRIINKNKNMFINTDGSIKKDFRGNLINLFEKEGFTSQYFIEDINRLSYAKLMDDEVEKGMTKVDYVKLGQIDEKVAQAFENLGLKKYVGNSVPTKSAFDAMMAEASEKVDVLATIRKVGYSSISDLRAAVNTERHLRSRLTYDYIFPGVTEIANDSLAKHGNKGSMAQGIFGELVVATQKAKGVNRQTALEIITKKMQDDKFNFLEGVTLGGELKNEALKMRAHNGALELQNNFATDFESFASINNEKLANLVRHMDKELNLTGEDRLVHNNVKVLEEVDGKLTAIEVKEHLGRAQFMDVNLNGEKVSNVLMASDSIVSARLMDDPETQTGVSQAFFDKRLEMVKAKKMYHQTGDPKYLARVQELQGELAGFSDVVKQMGITDQEIAIMEIAELNDASAYKLKKLKNNDLFESDALRGVFETREDGSKHLKEKFKNKKVLQHFTEQYKDLVLYDPTTEIQLTSQMVNKEEFSHLKEQYELATQRGRKIGVDSAQKFFDLEKANLAYEFDSTQAKLRDVEHLVNNGFEKLHINDFVNNYGMRSDVVDSIANKHLLIDLGDKFDVSTDTTTNARYIAIPGLGSIIGDDEVKAEYQKKLGGLSNDVTDYQFKLNKYGEEHAETIAAHGKVVNKASDIKELVTEIYGKNKVMHEATKGKVVAPSYRLKASGANGIYDTGLNASLDDNQALKLWAVKNQGALATAQINGKSLMDWEKEGIYYDYKFMSKDQFKEMGYYDKDYMAKLGIKSETEMTKYLKTQGSLDISDRYPNISANSLVTTRIYLDENLAANQTKVSRVTTLKYNGDFDGDSTSAHLLRVRNEKATGEYFWEDYAQYNKARLDAKKELATMDTPATEEQIRELATNGLGTSVTKQTYDEFKGIDAYMTLEAAGDNSNIWAKKVEKTMVEDSIKTAKNLDINRIASVEGGKSRLGKELFTQLSEHVDLKTFNQNEEDVNKGLEKIADLTGKDYTPVRDLDDIGKGLDAALVDMEKLRDSGKIDNEYFKSFEEAAIKRYRIDKTVQETMAKAGKGTIGSINVQLASVRQASEAIYGGTGVDRNIFRNDLILEINRAKEQEIISSKKMIVDYDENRITEYGNITKKIFRPKSSEDILQGKNELASWMDTYMKKSDFTSFYDNNVGVHISAEQNKRITKDLTGKALEDAKYNFIRDEYIRSITDLSQNEMAKSYMSMYGSVGKGGDRYYARTASAMAVSQNNSMTGIAMGQIKPELYERGSVEADTYLRHRETLSNKRVADSGEQASALRGTKNSLAGAAEALGGGLAKGLSGMSHHGLAMGALGTAMGLMISGYAAGNPLNEANAQTMSKEQQPAPKQNPPMSIPNFLDQQGGYVTGNSQNGYIINIKADTKKGRKHMEKAMKEAAQASVGGAVNINMNIRNSKDRGYSDKDIEKYIEYHLNN